MNKKYFTKIFEELFEDREFIAWVLKGINAEVWDQRMFENPEFKEKVLQAREIILLLRDTHEDLEKDVVDKIWMEINHFDTLNYKKVQSKIFQKVLRWAAVIIFFVIFGSLSYLYIHNRESDYHFVEGAVISETDARLILSTGEKIPLKKDNSRITVKKGEKLYIENDSVIDLSQKKGTAEGKLRLNEIIIPNGKRSEILLSDGTKVWLNAGSRLAFPTQFSNTSRKIFLEGEAYLEVVQDKSKPFIIKTPELKIRVLGTRFNISAYPKDNVIETVLLEGSLTISRNASFRLGKDEIFLKPNQKASFNKQNKNIVVNHEPDAEFYIAWTEGWFQFSGEKLKNVCVKLERYYNVKIEIEKNYLSTELISGKLDLKESLEGVLLALSDVAKIKFRIQNDIIYINKE